MHEEPLDQSGHEDDPRRSDESPVIRSSSLVLPPRNGDFLWVRRANDPLSRRLRHSLARETQEVADRGWYIYGVDTRVDLPFAEQAEACTRLISPDDSECPPLADKSKAIQVKTVMHVVALSTVDAVAKNLIVEGRQVAIISASSAFHVGGGFSTGGRHALEEALCSQSTLYRCLQAASRNIGAARGCRYIPPDGAILSPNVEMFRGGTSTGYAVLEKPLKLACVASIGMPNLNNKVRDAPCDTFPSAKAYKSALCDRWRIALQAARIAGATTVVCPDAGCGVYMNKAAVVGNALGDVIQADFSGCFESVWLVGSPEFSSSALAPTSPFRSMSFLSSAKRRQGASEQEDQDPGSVPSKATLTLSEGNLRRWLQSAVRMKTVLGGVNDGTASKRTGRSTNDHSEVSSARSDPDDWDVHSGTLGTAESSSVVDHGLHGIPSGHFKKEVVCHTGTMNTSTTTAASVGVSSTCFEQNAAADVAALLQAAAHREDVRLATQATPIQPPTSFNDQPGADLILVGSGSVRVVAQDQGEMPISTVPNLHYGPSCESMVLPCNPCHDPPCKPMVLPCNPCHRPGERLWRDSIRILV